MKTVRLEFGWSFKDQEIPTEWLWDDEFEYCPDVNYQQIARDTVTWLPHNGPTSVKIKLGDQTIAAWSKFNERREEQGAPHQRSDV